MSPLAFLQAEPAAFVTTAVLLGLLVGSFLNVVILRLPVMMDREWRDQCAELLEIERGAGAETEPFNLVRPRSRCPSCGHAIGALENVPVLSYLFLRGRCAGCGTRISLRYPMVEALTGLLSGVVAWHFGYGIAAAGALALTWALIALTFIDLDHQLLPDSITLPFLWLGLTLNLGSAYAPLDAAVIGAIAGYGFLWLVFHAFRLATGKEGMGYGDFKLMGLFGAWLGWTALPAVVLLSSAVGAVVGVAMIVARGHDRSVPIPFGPYIATAGWIALLWGEELTALYLRWSGLA